MSVLSPIIDSINGETRRIYLKSGVSNYYPIDDIYQEYKRLRATDENLRKYFPLLRAEGNIPKGSGAFTPRYVVLINGTKIVPFNESLQLNQLGDMITDNPDVDATLYDISTLTVAKPIFIKPAEAEIIQIGGGGNTANMWEQVIENGYTAEQIMRMLASVMAGKSTILDNGNGSATIVFRDLNDTVNRITTNVVGSSRGNPTLLL
jgi:hypothetical protein